MHNQPLTGYFTPHGNTHQPCWYCVHFDGMLYRNSAAACNAKTCCRVRSMPEYGCSSFEREPGVDDDGWRPNGTANARG